jgi:hypothetical protein
MLSIQLVPECFADTELVKSILGKQDYLNHADGIHSVYKILQKSKAVNYVNIGFIDGDKQNVPHYFSEFVVLKEHPTISFKKHPQSNTYIFVAQPAIEKFILTQLKEIDKQPSDYGLPNDFKDLRKKLKSSQIKNHGGFKSLLNDLKNKKTSGVLFITQNVSGLIKK